MTFDRSDYLAWSNVSRAKNDRASIPVLDMLAQAQVKAEALTNDPIWDLFLSNLQAMVEQTEVQRDAFKHKALDPFTSDIDRKQAQTAYFLCDERVKTLNGVISLPAEIKRNGEQAAIRLAKIGHSEEAVGGDKALLP